MVRTVYRMSTTLARITSQMKLHFIKGLVGYSLRSTRKAIKHPDGRVIGLEWPQSCPAAACPYLAGSVQLINSALIAPTNSVARVRVFLEPILCSLCSEILHSARLYRRRFGLRGKRVTIGNPWFQKNVILTSVKVVLQNRLVSRVL